MKRKDHIRLKYNGHCAYSGVLLTNETFSIDHMHPAKPKDNRIGNLQPCHKDINCFKGDLTFKQFNEELMIIQYRVVQGLRLKPEEKKIAELFDFEPDTYKTKLFFDIINLI